MADHLEGIEWREDAFIGHDGNAATATHGRHGTMVATACRLLEESHVQFFQSRRRPNRLLNGVAAVSIDRQPHVRPDGFPDRPQSFHVAGRMPMAGDLHFDGLPAIVYHSFRSRCRHVGLERTDHEFQTNRLRVGLLAAEQFVHRNA